MAQTALADISRLPDGVCVGLPPGYQLLFANDWPAWMEQMLSTYTPSKDDCDCEHNDDATILCHPKGCSKATRLRQCHHAAHDGKDCGNKEIPQFFHTLPGLEIFKCAVGRGVRSKRAISKGTVVGEYTGVVIELHDVPDPAAATHRFFMEMTNLFALDAQKAGSYMAFVNHSCEPNVKMELRYIYGANNLRYPRVFYVASEDIPANFELVAAYNYDSKYQFAFPCACGAGMNCRKRMDKPSSAVTDSSMDLSSSGDDDNDPLWPGCGSSRSQGNSSGQSTRRCRGRGRSDKSTHSTRSSDRSLSVPRKTPLTSKNLRLMTSPYRVLPCYERPQKDYHSSALSSIAWIFFSDDLDEEQIMEGQFWKLLHLLFMRANQLHHLCSEAVSFEEVPGKPTSWKCAITLCGERFLGAGSKKIYAKSEAAKLALCAGLSLVPPMTNISIPILVTAKASLSGSRDQAIYRLRDILAEYETKLMQYSIALGHGDMTMEEATEQRQSDLKLLFKEFFSLLPSHIAAGEILGFSACPYFALWPPAGEHLINRRKRAEMRKLHSLQYVSACGFIRFHMGGHHTVIAAVEPEIHKYDNIQQLAANWCVEDFIDVNLWKETYPPKPGQPAEEPTFAQMFQKFGMGDSDTVGNTVAVAVLTDVIYPPRNIAELYRFSYFVEQNVKRGVYNEKIWVKDNSISVSARKPGLVKGSVNSRTDTGDVIAAAQAGMTKARYFELDAIAKSEVDKMVLNNGNFSFQVPASHIEDLEKFCDFFVDRVRDGEVVKDTFSRPICNGEEFYIMPKAINAKKMIVRKSTVNAVQNNGWRVTVKSVGQEEVGLSVLACNGAKFLQETEVYLLILIRRYGEKTGRNYRRMRITSHSVLVFHPGCFFQGGHFDLMDANSFAVNVLVSKCKCGRCRFKLTSVFQDPRTGRPHKHLSQRLNPFMKCIQWALSNHVSMEVCARALPAEVMRDLIESLGPMGKMENVQELQNCFVPASLDAQVGDGSGGPSCHLGPGNQGNRCERRVLFFQISRSVSMIYDSESQVLLFNQIVFFHGMFSSRCMEFIVDAELVKGVVMTPHLIAESCVSRKAATKLRFSVEEVKDRDKTLNVSVGAIWSHVIDIVEYAAYWGQRIPKRPGQLLSAGNICQDAQSWEFFSEYVRHLFHIIFECQDEDRTALIMAWAASLDSKNSRPYQRGERWLIANVKCIASLFDEWRLHHAAFLRASEAVLHRAVAKCKQKAKSKESTSCSSNDGGGKSMRQDSEMDIEMEEDDELLPASGAARKSSAGKKSRQVVTSDDERSGSSFDESEVSTFFEKMKR